MKATITMLLAICLILGFSGFAAAGETEPLDAAGSFDTCPVQITQPVEWWRGADESIQPSVSRVTGNWLLDLKLFDNEHAEEITQSSFKILNGFPARVSNARGFGDNETGDYSTLSAYRFIMWIIPEKLTSEFRSNGHLDWPEPRRDVLVKYGAESWVETSPPVLSEEQKRELFEQALGQVHEVMLEDLHLYIYAPQATRAEFNLDWQDIIGSLSDSPGFEDATANTRVEIGPPRRVADVTVFLDARER